MHDSLHKKRPHLLAFEFEALHQARNLREEELRLTAAALLVRASVIDGKIDASERGKLKTLLRAI